MSTDPSPFDEASAASKKRPAKSAASLRATPVSRPHVPLKAPARAAPRALPISLQGIADQQIGNSTFAKAHIQLATLNRALGSGNHSEVNQCLEQLCDFLKKGNLSLVLESGHFRQSLFEGILRSGFEALRFLSDPSVPEEFCIQHGNAARKYSQPLQKAYRALRKSYYLDNEDETSENISKLSSHILACLLDSPTLNKAGLRFFKAHSADECSAMLVELYDSHTFYTHAQLKYDQPLQKLAAQWEECIGIQELPQREDVSTDSAKFLCLYYFFGELREYNFDASMKAVREESDPELQGALFAELLNTAHAVIYSKAHAQLEEGFQQDFRNAASALSHLASKAKETFYADLSRASHALHSFCARDRGDGFLILIEPKDLSALSQRVHTEAENASARISAFLGCLQPDLGIHRWIEESRLLEPIYLSPPIDNFPNPLLSLSIHTFQLESLFATWNRNKTEEGLQQIIQHCTQFCSSVEAAFQEFQALAREFPIGLDPRNRHLKEREMYEESLEALRTSFAQFFSFLNQTQLWKDFDGFSDVRSALLRISPGRNGADEIRRRAHSSAEYIIFLRELADHEDDANSLGQLTNHEKDLKREHPVEYLQVKTYEMEAQLRTERRDMLEATRSKYTPGSWAKDSVAEIFQYLSWKFQERLDTLILQEEYAAESKFDPLLLRLVDSGTKVLSFFVDKDDSPAYREAYEQAKDSLAQIIQSVPYELQRAGLWALVLQGVQEEKAGRRSVSA